MKTNIFKLFVLLSSAAMLVAGCNKDDESPFAGNDNYIAAFTLETNGITLKGAVSPEAIVISVPERLSLAGAVAKITLSENATISPDPSTITDWSTEQAFTVTAYNGATHPYTYRTERYLVPRDGDVVLLTQADVEAFAEAVKDVDQINGSITICAATGKDTITSLAGLEHLKIVTGDIHINATYKGDITAFESLEKMGDLRISTKNVKTVRFPKLAALRGGLTVEQTEYGKTSLIETIEFPALVSIDKGLSIGNAFDSLKTVHFPMLQQVEERIYMYGNYGKKQNLREVEFPALQNVGGLFDFTYWTALERISVPKLETVGDRFRLYGCGALRAVDLKALKTVNGNLTSESTSIIEEITLPKLENVTGDVSFYSSTLTTLHCPELKSAGGLSIPDNLTSMDFSKLQYIRNNLTISAQSLTSLDVFSALDSVGGQLELRNLTNLTEIDVRGMKIGSLMLYGTTYNGLTLIGDDKFSGELNLSAGAPDMTEMSITVQGFEEVGGLLIRTSHLKTVDLPWVKRIIGLLDMSWGGSCEALLLPNLQSVGAIQFYNTTQLKTLDMSNLEAVTGYATGAATVGNFTFNSCYLTSLTLPKLKSIEGYLSISYLSTTAISFSALKSITGTLTLNANSGNTFNDLSGFSALTSVAGITINGFSELKDFTPLKNVIPSLTANAWSIVRCGYNPTYQDMVNGKWKIENDN
jgi:hypothetical protein